MKPLGLTQNLRLVRSTPAEDKIWDSVEEAIAEGMTASDFRIEAAKAWSYEMKQQDKADRAALTD